MSASSHTLQILSFVGGQLIGWGRRRKGRPILRLEAPWLSIAGLAWQESAEDWHRGEAVRLLLKGGLAKVAGLLVPRPGRTTAPASAARLPVSRLPYPSR